MHLLMGEAAGPAFLTGMGLLAWRSWNWTMRNRKKKIEEDITRILDGAYTVRRHSTPPETGEGNGEIAFGILGSFGTGLLPSLLDGFERAGGTGIVGGILLGQLTRIERRQCLKQINPTFHDRITLVDCDQLPGGFQGSIYEEAIDAQDKWYNDLTEALYAWMRYLDRVDTELLILFVSPGGHLALVPTILATFRQRYPKKPVYVVTIMDDREVVRERFGLLRSLVAGSGAVRGSIIMDNTRFKARSDRGITTFLSGLAAGNTTNKATDQLANVLSYIFATTRTPRYATISVWAATIPIDYLPEADVSYTKVSSVEEKIVRGIKTLVGDVSYQSVPLPPADPGHYRHIEVILPLRGEEFPKLERRVHTNLEQWLTETDTELRISYASFAYDITPQTSEVPILVVLLQPLADNGSGLDEYTTPQCQSVLPATAGPTVTTAPPVRARGRPKGT